jgi:hypothetical protein
MGPEPAFLKEAARLRPKKRALFLLAMFKTRRRKTAGFERKKRIVVGSTVR